MTYSRPVTSAPIDAVSNGTCNMGTFNSAIQNVNLLDTQNPLGISVPKKLNNLRLKEWQAIQYSDENWFMCLAVYNTKTLGTAIIMAFNKQEQKMYRYEHKVPFWKLNVPSGLHNSHCYYHHKNLSIDIRNDLANDKIHLSFQAKNFKGCPNLAGDVLAHAVTEPIVIVQPFDHNRPLYSHKALMTVEGTISVNDHSCPITPSQGCMIIDDHKGFYPLKMKYDWVTALGYSPAGELQGFNLTDNQIQNPNKYNENCLWLNGKMHPLPPVSIDRPNGVEQTWIIKDRHNQVDLTFTPLADVPLKIKIGVVSLVDYHGPTGKLSGYIRDQTGEKVLFDEFIGMGEQKAIRM